MLVEFVFAYINNFLKKLNKCGIFLVVLKDSGFRSIYIIHIFLEMFFPKKGSLQMRSGSKEQKQSDFISRSSIYSIGQVFLVCEFENFVFEFVLNCIVKLKQFVY